MKKLLSVFCCLLYMRSISQASLDVTTGPAGTSGEKVLVKALTAIVNREGNKKTPLRKIHLSSYEYP
jgi:hypothetical protein